VPGFDERARDYHRRALGAAILKRGQQLDDGQTGRRGGGLGHDFLHHGSDGHALKPCKNRADAS
jgi:hypothetical protein